MPYRLTEVDAGFYDRRRQAVHVDVALIAYDDASRRVEKDQPLRHVVERGVEPVLFLLEPLLRFPVLRCQTLHDHE